MSGTRLSAGITSFLWSSTTALLFLLTFGLLIFYASKVISYPILVNTLFLGRISAATLDILLLSGGLAAFIGMALSLILAASTLNLALRRRGVDVLRYSALSGLALTVLALVCIISLSGANDWLHRLPSELARESNPSNPPAEISLTDCPEEYADYCLRRDLYLLPVLERIQQIMWTLLVSGLLIFGFNGLALDTETRRYSAVSAKQWTNLLPPQEGVCVSCGAREKCAFCRRSYQLELAVTQGANPKTHVFTNGERITVQFHLKSPAFQRYRPWFALFIPPTLRQISQLPPGWESVTRNEAQKLREHSAHRRQPDLVLQKDLSGDQFFVLEFEFQHLPGRESETALKVEYDESSRQSGQGGFDDNAPLLKELIFKIEQRARGQNRLRRLLAGLTSALIALLVLSAQPAHAQANDCPECRLLFRDTTVRVEYNTRAQVFMNPLLDLKISSTLNEPIRVRLPPDDLIVLQHDSEGYCNLIVAALVSPTETVPGDATSRAILTTVDIPAGEVIQVFAHAFCAEMNFLTESGETRSGNPFPRSTSSNRYVYPFNEATDAPLGFRGAAPTVASNLYAGPAAAFRDIFARAQGGVCPAPLRISFEPPETLPPDESANQCVARAFNNVPISTEPAAAPLPTERTLGYNDLAAQIAVFIAFAGGDAVGSAWHTYVDLLNNAVFLRDYPGIYCLLGLEQPPLSPALSLSPERESPYLAPITPPPLAGALYYRLQIARVNADGTGTFVRDELVSANPSFAPLDLRDPGEYAVCYSAYGTQYTYTADPPQLIEREPSVSSYRVRVTAQTFFPTPTPSGVDGAVVEAAGYTVPLWQIVVCPIGLILAGMVIITVIVPALRSQGKRLSRVFRVTLIVGTIAAIVIILIFALPVLMDRFTSP